MRFQWKDSHVDDVGCVAQEVQHALPEAVSGDIESGLHVAYDKLIPVLVEAVKHLLQRVDSLEKRLGPYL